MAILSKITMPTTLGLDTVAQSKKFHTMPLVIQKNTQNRFYSNGRFNFQNGSLVPAKDLNLENNVTCEVTVFGYLVRDDGPSSLVISGNMVVRDIYYNSSSSYSSGISRTDLRAEILIQNWVTGYKDGDRYTRIFRGHDTVAFIKIRKSNERTGLSRVEDEVITVADLKGCFAANNLNVDEVPADYLVP